MNNFPVNFSGVPHIGQKIFESLDFKDLNHCRSVCKGWLNFLGEIRSLWIKLLEKEEIKLESDLHLIVNFCKYATPEILVKIGAQNGGQNEGPEGQCYKVNTINNE